jgi:hypothetical protein
MPRDKTLVGRVRFINYYIVQGGLDMYMSDIESWERRDRGENWKQREELYQKAINLAT